jgi:2-keto-4-pentenoate hydratase
MMTETERAAVEWIAQRRISRQTVADLPPALKPNDEDAGYALQAAVLERLGASGFGLQVGWKVGFTTPQMRAYMGVDVPLGGGMLAGGRIPSGGTIRYADYCRVGIECEIAMLMAAPLGGPGRTVDPAEAAAAVGSIFPAIELVDDRYAGEYRAFGVPAIVADNTFHAGFVLGAPVEDWRRIDLGAVRGVTRANGAVTGEGRGADVQGHPMASLAWLANRLGTLGRRLEAGYLVLTGSLPLPYWANAGDVVEIEIEHLGAVPLTLAV